MKKITFIAGLLYLLVLLFIPRFAIAGAPLFTLTPLTPTAFEMFRTNTATVQYQVQNQSSKPHTLVMQPISGVTQVTSAGNCPNPFALSGKQSCILTLEVNGSQISNPLNGGPIICQQGPDGNPNPLLCYQPSATNILNITLAPQYTITPSAGANGAISPNSPQTINRGQSLSLTATPNPGYDVYQWLVDGVLAQSAGTTFTISNITANHNVNVTFIDLIFYSGTQNGNVYYSTNNGLTWTATTVPAGGSSVNSVFVANNTLYAGTSNGFIYYSTNNGNSWSNTSQPDTSAVNSVFVTANILYASTANGNVFYSTDNGNTWSSTSPPDGSAVNSIFVTSNALYAGTANGNVYYSTNNGTTWSAINSQPDGTAVNSIFVNNNTLYVGTANEDVYSSTALTGGGTWTTIAQSVYSLFVNSTNNTLYAGTQSGYVFSVTGGAQLGFVTYSPINSVYVLN